MIRVRLLAAAFLLSGLLTASETVITLSGTTQPTTGQPLAGSISVTGENFPNGNIPAANVTVSFAPATSGAGPSGSTAATSITTISGSKKRVVFEIPAAITVTAPTQYKVTVSGKTSAGAPFRSGNSAALTVNPPSQITQISPNSGNAGEILSVTITALYTNFAQGSTFASFGTYVSVGNGMQGHPGLVTVTSATTAVAQIGISSSAVAGPVTVTVMTGGQTASYTDGFTILPPAQITSVAPNAGNTGENLSVTITGQYTSFAQGTTTASFGPGISVGGAAQGQAGPVTVTSATTATAQLAIASNAATGPVTVAVTTGPQTASLANGFTILPPAQITSLKPASATAGNSVTVAITGQNTSFAQGVTVASFGPNVSVGGAAQGQAGPVTVTSATTANAQIAISPTAPGGAVTVTVTTGPQTASLTNGFTIVPAPQITSVSPNSGNAGLSFPVTITGLYTSFVQGTTVASFGAGISVGGAAEGQPGPVTVTSATTATAQISIDPAAATGPVTVTVTTGSRTASLANGFTIDAAVVVVNIETATATPLPPHFSGFSDPYLGTGVECTDPKYIAAIQPLKPGFIRFPAGLQSMAFDWQAGELNTNWINELAPKVLPVATQGLQLAQKLTQAKGGACFTATTNGGSCYANYQGMVESLSAATIVDFNGWTDTNTNSAANMVNAAKAAGLNVMEWELTNEPYIYTQIFPTAASYASSQQPYAENLFSANASAPVGVFYQGQFIDVQGHYQQWDEGMAAFTPQYWNAVSMHVYPISSSSLTTSQEEQTLNGVLAHGTNEYISSYVAPLIGNAPLFLTEFNSDAFGNLAFESYIYNGIFLAEYIARMSTASNVKGIAVHPLFLGNNFNQGIIRAVNDYQSYLLAELQKNPNYTTNTATDPNTQYQFYPSANALALEVLNQAVDSSSATWATTVSGGPTVPILGYDGNPIPAVFAQGFEGSDGTHYLVITNKSGSSVPLGVEVNGTLGPASTTVWYVSNASDTAQNTASDQNAVQVVNTTWANPMTIGPYSVTTLQW